MRSVAGRICILRERLSFSYREGRQRYEDVRLDIFIPLDSGSSGFPVVNPKIFLVMTVLLQHREHGEWTWMKDTVRKRGHGSEGKYVCGGTERGS